MIRDGGWGDGNFRIDSILLVINSCYHLRYWEHLALIAKQAEEQKCISDFTKTRASINKYLQNPYETEIPYI